MSRPTLTIVSLLLTVFAALSCRNREPGPVAPAVPDTPPALALDEGLTIRLSHAEPEAGERVVVPQ
ncbi:MAG: hypothetical protein K0V04_09790, partial [Deltaproteobacteria bacterium]|nr:hypothetical protein [Deltaproteobacteria bacterium]